MSAPPVLADHEEPLYLAAGPECCPAHHAQGQAERGR